RATPRLRALRSRLSPARRLRLLGARARPRAAGALRRPAGVVRGKPPGTGPRGARGAWSAARRSRAAGRARGDVPPARARALGDGPGGRARRRARGRPDWVNRETILPESASERYSGARCG